MANPPNKNKATPDRGLYIQDDLSKHFVAEFMGSSSSFESEVHFVNHNHC